MSRLRSIIAALALFGFPVTPGRECVGTLSHALNLAALAQASRRIALAQANRMVVSVSPGSIGTGAFSPRRVFGVVGASRLAGLRLNRRPVGSGLVQAFDCLPQGGAGLVVREAVRHALTLDRVGFRAKRAACHGAMIGSVAP